MRVRKPARKKSGEKSNKITSTSKPGTAGGQIALPVDDENIKQGGFKMKILARSIIGVAAMSLVALSGSALAQDHQHHQMTDEQLVELRAKIPLYREYSDEEIVAGMSQMKNSWGWVGETESSGTVGVLALAHGFREHGNNQFKTAYASTGATYPATYALGMAMMTSDHIQSAVTALEDAGAETIVIVPTTSADNSTLVRQWDYIFGLEAESAYLDVPRVQSEARLIWTDTPTGHPIISAILLDYALENSKNPSNELVIIMGHGPQSAEDNAIELEILARHADYLKKEGGFADVRYGNVQDDSPTEIRAANVEMIRGWATDAMSQGRDVLVVTTALTFSGVVGRMQKDVEGVAIFNDKGLMESPRFSVWIETAVAERISTE